MLKRRNWSLANFITQNLLLMTNLDITEILDSFGDFFEMFVTDVKGNSSDNSIALFFFC